LLKLKINLVYWYSPTASCDVADTQTFELLKHGRAMILLDGLDEVREKDNCRILSKSVIFMTNLTQINSS